MTCPMATSQMITSKNPMMAGKYLIPLGHEDDPDRVHAHITDTRAEDEERYNNKSERCQEKTIDAVMTATGLCTRLVPYTVWVLGDNIPCR